MRSATQPEFDFPEPRTWGGRRNGAGRRKRGDGVAHAKRERVTRHDPRLVTLKCAPDLPTLRSRPTANAIVECIRRAQRDAFKVVHDSIQSNHVHLLIEADDADALANGMRGFVSRIARTLNKLWRRRGRVFPERFHDVALRNLRQVRNALRYVLNNHLKHGAAVRDENGKAPLDEFSSARHFDGWRGRKAVDPPDSFGVVVARAGWKIGVGWKRHYAPIGVAEVPGPRRMVAAA